MTMHERIFFSACMHQPKSGFLGRPEAFCHLHEIKFLSLESTHDDLDITKEFFLWLFSEVTDRKEHIMLLEKILEKYPQTEDYLIEVLVEYQAAKHDHYITNQDILKLSEHFNITESKICSVLSFYTFFSNKPRGRYIIQVCKDVPCYINGSTNIIKTLEHELGIKMGETTPNQLFTLEYTSCLGCCDNPPAMRIDGKTLTHLTSDKIKAILAEYRGKK